MKTIEINVYKFKELDKQTKEKVIDNYRYINVEDTFWYDFIKEDFIRLGLEIRSFDLDRGSFAEIHIEDFEETSKNIIEEFGDNVPIQKTAKNYIDEFNKIQANFKEDEDIERELEILDEKYQREYSADILSSLREDYDYQVSDEAIIETIEANDYNFTWNGKIFRL
jgi:Lhr-like helicase